MSSRSGVTACRPTGDDREEDAATVRLVPDQEARDLACTLRSLFAAECPPTLARALHEPDGQRMLPTLRKALAQTGVFGLAVPTRYGGSGGRLFDVGVFAVEAGRALCPMIVHSTVLTALALQVLGSAEQHEFWLPRLCSGDVYGTTAMWSASDAAVLDPALRADATDATWRLSGTVDFVADADLADIVAVTALEAATGRVIGFVVDTRTAGVGVEPLDMMGGHRAARVRFDDVVVDDPRAVLAGVNRGGLAQPSLRRVANIAVALTCLDLVGVAEAVLERTVDYTVMRHQFGRPIASFQAAQHLIADMRIAVSAARLAAQSALFRLGKGHTATRETAIARMHAATAAKQATLDAHQLHGGMGYVTETDLHLWSERARVLSTLGGGADTAAAWLERELELAGTAPRPQKEEHP